MFDVQPRYFSDRNALGFLLTPHTLSPGKWLSNPNRSSTRKSCASR
jgi:hypothetical protein